MTDSTLENPFKATNPKAQARLCPSYNNAKRITDRFVKREISAAWLEVMAAFERKGKKFTYKYAADELPPTYRLVEKTAEYDMHIGYSGYMSSIYFYVIGDSAAIEQRIELETNSYPPNPYGTRFTKVGERDGKVIYTGYRSTSSS